MSDGKTIPNMAADQLIIQMIESRDAEIERLRAALQMIADDPDTDVSALAVARNALAATNC